MESANLHHHQHQHHLQGQFDRSSSPSLSSSPSCYGAPSPHAWTQNITLNPDGVGIKQRQKNETSSIPSPLNNSIIQDLGFHWNINTNQHDHILQLGKIKEEEQLSHSFTKFTEMINTPSTLDQDSHQKYMSDLSEKLLLKTISSGFPINSPSQIYSTCIPSSRGNFSQIYPTINISPPPPSFDVNLDLLTSTRFSGSIGQPSRDNNLDIYKDNVPYDLHHMHQSNHLPSSSPRKVSSFTTNEITEAKRPNSSLMEPKATLQAAPKKSRLETRASCAPFKVRKEKLGDRIAALQQLVAPFGKTDTASVLMEAIGYIKFLQNQVETLSVPYMKSSRNKSNRNSQAGSNMEEGNDEPKKDLRSRGLCLVPFSCMSYVTGDGGGTSGGIWPPPNFGGGT